MAPGSASGRLELLKSPTYRALGLWRDREEAEDLNHLTSVIKGKSRAQALEILVKALRREAARILRMMEDRIDPHRPLSEAGFDSLMLLELVMCVERLTGMKVRMIGAGERTLTTLANGILNELIGPPGLTAPERATTHPPIPFTRGERYGEPRSDMDPSLQSQRATVADEER
jgi:acyl carrier protein